MASATAHPAQVVRIRGPGDLDECPCHYRVAITGKTLIVPPDARLLKDGMVRVITGCTNPWAHPLLSECARPSR